MEYTIIEVPDLNDSMSRVVLNGKAYLIRFTWNDRGGFWKFGLYDTQSQPIVIGIKMVPRFPANLFYGVTALPSGRPASYSALRKIATDPIFSPSYGLSADAPWDGHT